MKLSFAFGLLLLMTVISATSLAQDTRKDTTKEDLLKVESRPSGAVVELQGVYNFTGRTPFTVPYPVQGYYKIKANKQGYESLSSEVNLVGSQDSEIVIRLKPKTRFKAMVRSFVFPGWGQFYRGDKLRGIVITGTQLALGAASLLAVNEYSQSQNALERATQNFQREMTVENANIVDRRLAEAQDDYDFRNTVLIITGAFWLYNLVDSFLFFPSDNLYLDIQTKNSAVSSNNQSIKLSWKFGL